MKTLEAKRAVRRVLKMYGMSNRISAQKVHFTDLVRAGAVFVTVHDWRPDSEVVAVLRDLPGVIINYSERE